MGFEDDSTTRIGSPASARRLGIVRLVVIDGPSRGKEIMVSHGLARIGSAPENDLVLDDPFASRIHCELRVGPSGIQVRDPGSTNGVWLESARLIEAEILPGTTLTLGKSSVRVDSAEGSCVALSANDSFGELIGGSVAMRQAYAVLERVAPTDATLLVRGETGTGKELVARSVHAASPRRQGPFVALDCSAIPEPLFESELFGHKKGAFSGATADRIGVVEEADGGTLFLDEIGELPMAMQAKLLRVLETRTLRPVGANAMRSVDVRFLAATHRPLDRAVNEGTFREDLYYRLAVVEVVLPPLRARLEDIPTLASHFHRARGGQGELPPAFIESLLRRSFPGNVRELKHSVERAMILGTLGDARSSAEKPLRVEDAIDVALSRPLKEAREEWTERFELSYATKLLQRTQGNVTRAAELAGVNRRFLQRLMTRLGLSSRDFGGSDEE